MNVLRLAHGLHNSHYQALEKTPRQAFKARLGVFDCQKVCGA